MKVTHQPRIGVRGDEPKQVAAKIVGPGLTRASAYFSHAPMRGGWVYIMTDRYRGALYVGVTSNLAERIGQHRKGIGSDYCSRRGLTRLVWAERGDAIGDCIAHEKRLKRWHRQWKFDLIEKANPDWDDLFDFIS